jgi:hypothetical protein
MLYVRAVRAVLSAQYVRIILRVSIVRRLPILCAYIEPRNRFPASLVQFPPKCFKCEPEMTVPLVLSTYSQNLWRSLGYYVVISSFILALAEFLGVLHCDVAKWFQRIREELVREGGQRSLFLEEEGCWLLQKATVLLVASY